MGKSREFLALLLSHHPLCPCFREDVWYLGPVALCRGCTSVIIGFVIIYAIQFFTAPIPYLVVPSTILVLALVTPTFVVVVYKPQRWVKDFTRLMAGTALGYSAFAFRELNHLDDLLYVLFWFYGLFILFAVFYLGAKVYGRGVEVSEQCPLHSPEYCEEDSNLEILK